MLVFSRVSARRIAGPSNAGGGSSRAQRDDRRSLAPGRPPRDPPSFGPGPSRGRSEPGSGYRHRFGPAIFVLVPQRARALSPSPCACAQRRSAARRDPRGAAAGAARTRSVRAGTPRAADWPAAGHHDPQKPARQQNGHGPGSSPDHQPARPFRKPVNLNRGCRRGRVPAPAAGPGWQASSLPAPA